MRARTYQWLRAHHKVALAHGFVLSGFVIFLVFFSGPLFDRFAAIEGESRILSVRLPAETGNVIYCVTDVEIGAEITEIHGWAFVEGQDSQTTQCYIVLESDDACYVFDTIAQLRQDITTAYDSVDLDFSRSGFVCNLPTRKIAPGENILGIYIKQGDFEAFQRTEFLLVASDGGIKLITRQY